MAYTLIATPDEKIGIAGVFFPDDNTPTESRSVFVTSVPVSEQPHIVGRAARYEAHLGLYSFGGEFGTLYIQFLRQNPDDEKSPPVQYVEVRAVRMPRKRRGSSWVWRRGRWVSEFD